MNRPRTVFLTGVLLVVFGVFLVIATVNKDSFIIRFIPLVAGVAICIAGVTTRVPGMYLPGMIVAGLGVGVAITFGWETVPNDPVQVGVFLTCTGCALGLMPLLSRLTGWKLVFWPYIPAALLSVAGVSMLVLDPTTGPGKVLVTGWPLIAFLAALYIVVVFWRRSKL